MVWTIKYTKKSLSELKKIDKQEAKRIVDFVSNRIALSNDPREIGKALTGNLKDFWRYRVGNYRIIADIQDETISIYVIKIGHRKNIYD